MKKTVLVVEDEILLLKAIVTKLDSLGFNVASCRTVKQAKNLINDLPHFDAIWLDHYLPGADGLEFVRYLQGSKQWKNIPVFLISNTSDSSKIKLYKKMGVNKFYVKANTPISDVAREMEKYLYNHNKTLARV